MASPNFVGMVEHDTKLSSTSIPSTAHDDPSSSLPIMNFSSAAKSAPSKPAPASAGPSTASAPVTPVSDEAMLLFSRGMLALFNLWPALRLAVDEQWGGPESEAKRTWFVSVIVDEFESRPPTAPAPSAGETSTITASGGSAAAALAASVGGLELDELSDLLFDLLLEEFTVDLDDDSPRTIAAQIIALWTSCLKLETDLVLELESQEAKLKSKGKKVKAEEGMEVDEDLSGTDEDDDDDFEDVSDDEEEAPACECFIFRSSRERPHQRFQDWL